MAAARSARFVGRSAVTVTNPAIRSASMARTPAKPLTAAVTDCPSMRHAGYDERGGCPRTPWGRGHHGNSTPRDGRRTDLDRWRIDGPAPLRRSTTTGDPRAAIGFRASVALVMVDLRTSSSRRGGRASAAVLMVGDCERRDAVSHQCSARGNVLAPVKPPVSDRRCSPAPPTEPLPGCEAGDATAGPAQDLAVGQVGAGLFERPVLGAFRAFGLRDEIFGRRGRRRP